MTYKNLIIKIVEPSQVYKTPHMLLFDLSIIVILPLIGHSIQLHNHHMDGPLCEPTRPLHL